MSTLQLNQALVVIPTYQERCNLPELLEGIHRADSALHILVVDDHSGDGTPAYVRSLDGFGQTVFLMERKCKEGLSQAYLAGFDWALQRDYGAILQMDADLSHDPADLPRLLEMLRQEGGVILGSRYVQGIRVLNWPVSRLLLSLAASWYVRILLNMPVADPTGGFRAWEATLLRGILRKPIASHGYAFQIETLHRSRLAGVRPVEVPIVFGQRQNGESKMSRKIAIEAVFRVLQMGFSRLTSNTKHLINSNHPQMSCQLSASKPE